MTNTVKSSAVVIFPRQEKRIATGLTRSRVNEVNHNGQNWVTDKVSLRMLPEIGLGLFANSRISKNETVIVFGGRVLTLPELLSLPPVMQDIPYQISDDLFFGPDRPIDVGRGEQINHSCRPNCGFTSEMVLVAIKPILAGEHVTMDYGACMSIPSYELKCLCGEPDCRGVIKGDDWRLRSVQTKLKGYFQPYLQKKIARQRKKHSISRLK